MSDDTEKQDGYANSEAARLFDLAQNGRRHAYALMVDCSTDVDGQAAFRTRDRILQWTEEFGREFMFGIVASWASYLTEFIRYTSRKKGIKYSQLIMPVRNQSTEDIQEKARNFVSQFFSYMSTNDIEMAAVIFNAAYEVLGVEGMMYFYATAISLVNDI